MNFEPMPKIPRLSRDIVVTEKIDGTNASVWIGEESFLDPDMHDPSVIAIIEVKPRTSWYPIRAGSRTRWITPDDDNYGFARWVRENAEELCELGPGHHFGEWWGKGIQSGYGLGEKRFSLFNVNRWSGGRPACCHVVPILYQGLFLLQHVEACLYDLRQNGSKAAPGFMRPEGVMVYHSAGNVMFKKTCWHDDEPKSAHIKKEKPPRPPRDPNTGGRRKAQVPIDFKDRRHAI